MANSAMGLKRRRNLAYKQEDNSYTYSNGGGSSNRRGDRYNTGDNTLKKTKGIDEGTLQGTKKENRGRKKADAPRGKKKQKTKYERTKRTTKKGRD